MSLLSMVEARLPPGFRFHPRDDELICDYVAPKVAGDASRSFFGCQMLIEVDLNTCEPWDLPEMALVGGKDWYFFCLKDRKYATGLRANRATPSGYWKATGKDKLVSRNGLLVGMRKTLVFYRGRAPKGRKTEWVMHEFRMESPGDPPKHTFEEDWVLCRIFNKSREMSMKLSYKNSEDNASSSLPHLPNSYIAFNQALPNLEVFEQVPCFSSFPVSSELSSLFPEVGRNMPTKSVANLGMTTVLNCLTKLDGNQRVQESPQSFLSETGLSSVWNPY